MSAKLLKSLAANNCTVVNRSSSEVMVYWKDAEKQTKYAVLRPQANVDLLQFATVAQLRASSNLKSLFNAGHLKMADPE